MNDPITTQTNHVMLIKNLKKQMLQAKEGKSIANFHIITKLDFLSFLNDNQAY